MGSSKVSLLNIKFDNPGFEQALIDFNTKRFTVTPNIDHLYNLQHNREFLEAYRTADFILCDSKIISMLSRFACRERLMPVAGADFFPALCGFYSKDPAFKIFLLGGTTDIHSDTAREKLNARFGPVVVGNYSPPFGFEKEEQEIKKIIELVNVSAATVLAIGVGSPKQELFINSYAGSFLKIKHFIAIGATIDFESGMVKRAPEWMKAVGMEWFYRFLSEPKRLFRRYFIAGPQVVFKILLFRFKREEG
ncbi:MAG TPA: WecB/TagA/CpsF family glycosyltransferase [Panacibacter sp.]|nr:WecB/TagA/CpsF family glycosyltransferase [Panacibacter sp.]HNP46622.1 WecB/TagA/CpsF family glycosyltransferase [Panacibacter sp.]